MSSELSCVEYHSLMEFQVPRLKRAIEKNKWYLSELAGYDVGHEVAQADFLKHHFVRCANEWRSRYCSALCAAREGCTLGQVMIERILRETLDPEWVKRLDARAEETGRAWEPELLSFFMKAGQLDLQRVDAVAAEVFSSAD